MESSGVTEPSRAVRVAITLLGAFAGYTLAWIGIGAMTPGDVFGGGAWSLLLLPLGAAALGFAGYRAKRPHVIGIIAALAGVSAYFWIRTRDGWWAHGPPNEAPESVHVTS